MEFSQPQEYIVTSTQPINLFLAGVGSGKTHLAGAISGYYITNFPEVFGFIGANTHSQLTQSTMFRIREVWAELFGWREGIDYVSGKMPPKHFNTDSHNFDRYDGIISFKSGAVVFKGSLENAKAHDGKEFGWAILDETKDSREEDVKETIITRMRSMGIYVDDSTGQISNLQVNEKGELNRSYMPLYILTSPAKVDWINEWFKLDKYQHDIQQVIYSEEDFFVREFDDKCVVISSTYHNAQNLPPNYIPNILNNNSEEAGKKLIYGNPFVKVGGEFYSGFNRLDLVKSVPYIEGLPLHLSLDQNVVPYVTGTLYQLLHRDADNAHLFYTDATIQVRQFGELCLKNPKNTTSKLCLEFIRLYGSKAKNGLFYYGDPAGRHRDTRANEHDYKIVDRLLRKYLNNRSNRVPYKHPSVLKRKDFANNIFEGVYGEIEFIIDEKCKNSIADFEFLKEDVNGKKAKTKVKDAATGQTYEKYGHTSDTFDYFITKVFEKKFKREFK